MRLTLITAPVETPVDLAETKRHLRLESDDEDALVLALIQSATEHVEQETGRALMPQTWDMVLDAFPECDVIELPLPPLQSVTSVKYLDTAGVEQTLDSSHYRVDASGLTARILLEYGESWPATQSVRSSVTVRCVVGYADQDAVPFVLKQYLLIMIGSMYEHRESVVVGPAVNSLGFVDRLLDRFRIPRSA